MLRLALDFVWWVADRGWGWVRAVSGDDAYERHLAGGHAGIRTRRQCYDDRIRHHWARLGACGRCFGPHEPREPDA